MPLTAESLVVLQVLKDAGVKALHELPAAEGRDYFNAVFKTKPEDQEPVTRIEDRRIPVSGGDIPIRIYAPQTAGNRPALVHFHGGGWVYLNLDTHDGYCRQLANRTGCVVVAVEYRKAPEFPAPTAAEDCYAALQWVAANGGSFGVDTAKLGVVGDSAGGNLAAVVAQLARDRKSPKLALQLLTYPATDGTMSHASIKENATAPILGEAEMSWFWNHYLGKNDKKNPIVSPLYAESLAGLPPAFVSTAEFDPLRDEGESYAAKMKAAGVEVDQRRYAGVFHGFMLMGKIIPEARQLVDDQTAFVKKHFAM
ncbi:MAG: alpha/beta hydrolase [Gammaproteobacteria bacterium]|nr:alpha/beta hydrolase [Gammaproteobacteria bacterium]MBI5618390.1 alpha/beta hydrolase [Gammaproteobacteria bacterium]